MTTKGASHLSNQAVMAELLFMLTGIGQWWGNLVEEVTSTQLNGEDYGFLGGVKPMEEKTGDPNPSRPKVFPYFIRNRRFELSAAIPLPEFEHAAPDKLRAWIRQHGVVAGNHPGVLLRQLINLGETNTCYDGNEFYATDHAISIDGAAATQSNLLTKTVSSTAAITEAEMEDAILGAVEAFYNQRDDQGNEINLNLNEFSLLCSTGVWKFAQKALKKMFISGGSSNPLAVADGYEFRVRPQFVPSMTATLFDLVAAGGNDGSPFIYQVLEGQKERFLGPESEHATTHDEVLAVITRYYNIGFGRYQRAVRTKFST